MSCDVAIVGAGVIGCAAAAELALAGLRVEVFEAEEVAAGASGRNSGAIEHPFDTVTTGLYERTLEMLRELDEVPIADEPAGMFQLCFDEASARAEADHHAGFGDLVAGVLDPDALREIEPQLAPGLWAALLRTGYPVHPAVASYAFRDRALTAGAVFHTQTPAAVEVHDGRASGVRTADGVTAAAHVLVAAGALSGPLLALAGAPLPISASWGVNAEVRMAAPPQILMTEAEIAHFQVGGEAPDRSAFSLITSPGGTALGSTFLSVEPDPQEWLERLVTQGSRFVPGLAEAERIGVRACARPLSADGRPFLGPVGVIEGLHVCAGHGGRGISTGPASAELVAHAIAGGDASAIPPALSASRSL